jgi:hypothetical protein
MRRARDHLFELAGEDLASNGFESQRRPAFSSRL